MAIKNSKYIVAFYPLLYRLDTNMNISHNRKNNVYIYIPWHFESSQSKLKIFLLILFYLSFSFQLYLVLFLIFLCDSILILSPLCSTLFVKTFKLQIELFPDSIDASIPLIIFFTSVSISIFFSILFLSLFLSVFSQNFFFC